MGVGRGIVRGGRVGAFALAAVSVASVAHVAGGGRPSLVAALLAIPAVMVVVNPLAGRRRGPVALGLTMLGVQAVLHVAFMAADLDGTCSAAAHGHGAVTCGPGAGGGMAMTGEGWVPSPGMLAAHLGAAALLVVVLARGEAALWALAAWLLFVALRFVGDGPVWGAGPATSRPMIFCDVPVHDAGTTKACQRRGPPRLTAVA